MDNFNEIQAVPTKEWKNGVNNSMERWEMNTKTIHRKDNDWQTQSYCN